MAKNQQLSKRNNAQQRGNGNQQKDRVTEIREMFVKVGPQITAALARQLDPDQFVRTCLTRQISSAH